MISFIKELFVIQPSVIETYELELQAQRKESEMILAELDNLLATTESYIKELKG